ncbi:hypothetical protein FACS1894217_15290 [Clostridia bacterium]|nr:hypothetical protein FACS1894217_15290 [Clostridia bacterium]
MKLHKNIAYIGSDNSLINATRGGVRLVLIDFGQLLAVDKHGDLPEITERHKDLFHKLVECDFQVAMGKCAPWHVSSVTPYADGRITLPNATYMFDGEPPKNRLPRGTAYNRGVYTFDMLLDSFGLNKTRKPSWFERASKTKKREVAAT